MRHGQAVARAIGRGVRTYAESPIEPVRRMLAEAVRRRDAGITEGPWHEPEARQSLESETDEGQPQSSPGNDMRAVSNILVIAVAIEHLWFLVLEMFLWTKPLGLKTFRMSLEQAKASATLAANQGLYNGFLAAGLIWGLVSPPDRATAIKLFFLTCVLIAGVFGALTVSRRILWVQGLPAFLALVLLALSTAR